MKIEITEAGWQEITIKKIVIKAEFENFLKDMTVSDWDATNERLKLKRPSRKVCGCCHSSWKKLTGNIHLLQTNVENKIICDSCYEKLKPVLESLS